VRLWKR